MAKNITFENGRRTTTDNLFPTTIIELERQFGSKIELVDGEPYKAENGLATPGKKKYEKPALVDFADISKAKRGSKTGTELTSNIYILEFEQYGDTKRSDVRTNGGLSNAIAMINSGFGVPKNKITLVREIKSGSLWPEGVYNLETQPKKAKRGTKTEPEDEWTEREDVYEGSIWIAEPTDYDKAIDKLIIAINRQLKKKKIPLITTEKVFDKEREFGRRVFTDNDTTIRIYETKADRDKVAVEFRFSVVRDAPKKAKAGAKTDNSVQFIKYKGEEIMFEPINKEYFVNDNEFKTLAEAKKYIDSGSPLSDAQINLYRHGAMKNGGKTATGPIKASASAILKELIDTDIIDEEHPLYEQSKNAIASGNSEEITGILDELIQADIIDKSHPEYKAIKNITKAENGLDTENYEPIKITDIEIGKTKEFGNFSVMRKKKNTFILSNVKGGPRNRWGTINQINEDLQYALENGKLPDPYKFASSGMKTAEDVEDVSGWDDEELANYLGIKTSEIQNDREGYEEQATDLMVEGANNHDEMKLGGKAGRGMSTPSIERHVKEVNRLIALAKNSKGEPLTVTDRSGSWQSPMIYEPIVYKNGRMTVKYKELDLYSHNRSKGVISQWEEKKDVILKSQMSFDHPLNIIAKLYRKALKDEGIDYKTKAEETPGLKTYRCGGKMARVGVKTGNIKPSKEFMVFNYTDNIYASPDTFANQKKAKEFVKEFRNRFATQGYYKDNRMRQVAIKDIDLEIIPANFSPFTGEYN